MPKDLVFYVYILFDWLGVPRYVGKGKGSRWLNHERKTDQSNILKNEFIEQTWIMLDEVPKIIIKDKINEQEAFEIEIALIKAIGRIDLGTGPLVNLTDGGDGASGSHLSPLQRATRSKAVKRGMQKLGPDAISDRVRRGRAAMTQEERTAIAVLIANNQTPEQHRSRGLKAASSLTPKQRSDRSKLGASRRTPENKKRAIQKYQETMTPEKLAARGKLISISQTTEERSAAAKKGLSLMTTEALRERSLLAAANQTPEQRSDKTKRGRAKLTLEQRQEGTRQGQARRTPEERSNSARQGHITRQRNKTLSELIPESPSQ